jgi:5-methylcytosine-specific restriction endonuclease McrA
MANFEKWRSFKLRPVRVRRRHALTSGELRKIWQSDEWKEFVRKNLKDQCMFCGSRDALVLHHRTLVFKVESYMASSRVVTLCNRCHHLIHTRNVKELSAIQEKNRATL